MGLGIFVSFAVVASGHVVITELTHLGGRVQEHSIFAGRAVELRVDALNVIIAILASCHDRVAAHALEGCLVEEVAPSAVTAARNIGLCNVSSWNCDCSRFAAHASLYVIVAFHTLAQRPVVGHAVLAIATVYYKRTCIRSRSLGVRQ